MKKWICIILLIILALGMYGCTSKEKDTLSEVDIPDATLPETVELSFKPIEMTPLAEQKQKENWELIKSLPFGTIENELATILIYKENNNSDNGSGMLKAQLKHKEHTYALIDDVSNNVLEGTAEELNNGLIQQASYLLQHIYGEKKNQVYLQGGIELSANGPGRVAYLVYDSKQSKWLQFEVWGIPYLEDLDSDQAKEMVIQFPGLHMQLPDVQIIRWNKGQLEVSGSFQAELGIVQYQPSTVYFEQDNNKYFKVDVNTSGDLELTDLANATFKYEQGKLLKVK